MEVTITLTICLSLVFVITLGIVFLHAKRQKLQGPL